jgi:hypothetical protein
MINKKGDKLISIYWFVILVLVAGGIIAMVHVFYSSPYDVREIEAEILSNKVADCISFGGEMNSRLISLQGVFKESFKDNFLQECSLNFDSNKEFEPPEYYVEVGFYPGAGPRESFSLMGGNKNYKQDCELEESLRKKLVQCSEREFFTLSPNGQIYLIKVLSIVRNTEKNVQ